MRVFLGQSGVVTAYGWGLDALWQGLLSGKTAIAPTDRFAQRGFVSTMAAQVPGLDVHEGQSRALAMLSRLLAPLAGRLDPMTPLILATTVGEIEFVERAVLQARPADAADAQPRVLLERIKQLLGLRGQAMVVSSACASSSAALTRAASIVRHAQAPAVLVVTCDALSEFVYAGFSSLASLCAEPARPFDANRTGLTLGEAAAWGLVTSDVNPAEEEAPAEILGWGNTTDAIHMTAPDPTGGGLSRAIVKACVMASRAPSQVAFIAAHGTATPYSDAMELAAFRAVIHGQRPVFSVKGGVGHTLAAAGLLQVLVSRRALARGVVPPTVGLATPDPAAVGWACDRQVALAPDPARQALSTNSGFGGVNTAVLLGGGEP